MINVERKTYYALDVAKFISAFLVVCIHTGPLLDVDATGNFILVQILARLAVPFFFVASGFLFSVSWISNANTMITKTKQS